MASNSKMAARWPPGSAWCLHSTAVAAKDRLLGISKRGDSYVRTLLIHGARASQRAAINKTDPRSVWVNALGQRRHKNVAALALANKNARIAWVILSRAEDYRAQSATCARDGAITDALPTNAHEASAM